MNRRLPALDGLRGAAALIVVLHHCLLVDPRFAAAYYGAQPSGFLQTLLFFTPVHLFWSGTEAVYVFFILSGLVLCRMTASATFRWSAYYPARLVRLYGPTIAAVLVGAVIIMSTSSGNPGSSPWLANQGGAYTLLQFTQDLTLIPNSSSRISPLWSLTWEVLFSLALPAYMLLGKKRAILKITLLIGVSTFGSFAGSQVLTFMPMFGIGVVLAIHWDAIMRHLNTLTVRTQRVLYPALFVAAIILIESYWILRGLSQKSWVGLVSMPLILAGATIMILLACVWLPLTKLLCTRVFAWLGKISFSLYLVHGPLVVGFAFLTGGTIWGIIVAFATSFVMAAVFFRFVERPMYRVSHTISTRVRDASSAAG
jgi:peptidoglycan/LPS O-acetylase OafA/YrhL